MSETELLSLPFNICCMGCLPDEASCGAILILSHLLAQKPLVGGAWVAQLAECPTSAQVMVLWFWGLSPMTGSMLTAQSLDPASDSVFPSLSALPLHMLSLLLSLSQK